MSVSIDNFPATLTTPILAHWDITSGCNFRCTFCLTSSGSTDPCEITTKEAFALVDKLYNAGVLFLRIMGGEPFFRKDIIDIFHYAVSKGMILSFSTNASLLNSETVAELSKMRNSIRYVQMSLYGFNEESYEITTGSKQNFLKAINGVNLLREKFQPTILIVITEDNVDYIKKYVELANSFNPKGIRLVTKTALGRSTTSSHVSVWSKLIIELIEIQKEFKKVRIQASPLFGEYLYKLAGIKTFYQNCDAATKMLYLDSTGRVYPCPFIKHLPAHLKEIYRHLELDSMRDKSVCEVWNNESFQQVRRYYEPQHNLFKINNTCKLYNNTCTPCVLTPCNCLSLIDSVKKLYSPEKIQERFH